MKKTLLLITITLTTAQMQAQRLYVQYKFNPELQALLENPDKTALYYTYAAQPISEEDRAEYTAIQIRFTDDTGTHELARYTLSPGRIQQLEFMLLHCAGRMPFVTTEEEFLDLSNSRFAGLTAESFDVISRLVDHVTAIEHDKRLSAIDAFLRTEFARNPMRHPTLFSFAFALTRALNAMDASTLEREIALLAATPAYLADSDREQLPKDITPGTPTAQGIQAVYTDTIVIPHWQTEKILKNPRDTSITAIAWSPDCKQLATGNCYGGVRVWDLTKKITEGKTIGKHDSTVYSIAWSPDSTRLASSSEDYTVRLWNLEKTAKETIISYVRKVYDCVCLVTWSPNGTHITGSSKNGATRTWDLTQKMLEPTTSTPLTKNDDEFLCAPTWSHNGKYCAHVQYDGQSIHVWTLTKSTPTELIIDHLKSRTFALAWSPDGTHLASGDLDGAVHLWDITQEIPQDTILGNLNESIFALTWSPDGKQLACGCKDGTVHVLGLAQEIPMITRVGSFQNLITSLAWSPDGKQLAAVAAACNSCTLHVLGAPELESLTPAHQLKMLAKNAHERGGVDRTTLVAYVQQLQKTVHKSDLAMLEEQITDLIQCKNFEAAETIFEKYQEHIRASNHYKKFAQAIAEWRIRNGNAGSSGSSK